MRKIIAYIRAYQGGILLLFGVALKVKTVGESIRTFESVFSRFEIYKF